MRFIRSTLVIAAAVMLSGCSKKKVEPPSSHQTVQQTVDGSVSTPMEDQTHTSKDADSVGPESRDPVEPPNTIESKKRNFIDFNNNQEDKPRKKVVVAVDDVPVALNKERGSTVAYSAVEREARLAELSNKRDQVRQTAQGDFGQLRFVYGSELEKLNQRHESDIAPMMAELEEIETRLRSPRRMETIPLLRRKNELEDWIDEARLDHNAAVAGLNAEYHKRESQIHTEFHTAVNPLIYAEFDLEEASRDPLGRPAWAS